MPSLGTAENSRLTSAGKGSGETVERLLSETAIAIVRTESGRDQPSLEDAATAADPLDTERSPGRKSPSEQENSPKNRKRGNRSLELSATELVSPAAAVAQSGPADRDHPGRQIVESVNEENEKIDPEDGRTTDSEPLE